MEEKVNHLDPIVVDAHFDRKQLINAGGGMIWLFALEKLPDTFALKTYLIVFVPPFMISLSWLSNIVIQEFKRYRKERALERTRLIAMIDLEGLLANPTLDDESKEKLRAMQIDVKVSRALELTEKPKRLSRPE